MHYKFKRVVSILSIDSFIDHRTIPSKKSFPSLHMLIFERVVSTSLKSVWFWLFEGSERYPSKRSFWSLERVKITCLKGRVCSSEASFLLLFSVILALKLGVALCKDSFYSYKKFKNPFKRSFWLPKGVASKGWLTRFLTPLGPLLHILKAVPQYVKVLHTTSKKGKADWMILLQIAFLIGWIYQTLQTASMLRWQVNPYTMCVVICIKVGSYGSWLWFLRFRPSFV